MTKNKKAQNVLVLGAGLVARPLVHYLLQKTPHNVICASRTVSKAEELVRGFARGHGKPLNVEDKASLEALVANCDIAISLLPYTHHVTVAELCIKHRKHMVTTSYVSDKMRALDVAAREAGILILNEIGLDPGIDHMSAMRIIDQVHRDGGSVKSFKSYCGGLPVPEANTNPLGYKFSWSPRGVLMAGRNTAKYLEEGRTVEIPGTELFNNHWLIEVPGAGAFETYFNRNSVPYQDIYGIKEARTLYRCTLRNPGWCEFWYRMAALGWLNDTPRSDLAGKTWGQVLRTMVPGKGSVLNDLCKHWGMSTEANPVARLTWLGLDSDTPLPAGPNNLLDLMCALLIKKLEFAPKERDLIVLFHDFVATYPNRTERITSTMIDYGLPEGDSAMSRTVSLPAAIAVRHILEGTLNAVRGVQIPVLPEIYKPVLDELDTMGIRCIEATTRLS